MAGSLSQSRLFGRQFRSLSLTQSLFLLFIMSLVFTQASFAAQLTLTWDANPDASAVVGYKVHYGYASGDYTFVADAGNATTITLSGLDANRIYFFAATAYDSNGLESDYSEELACNLASTQDEDKDGLLDSWELTYFGNLSRDGSGDFDGDGLSDYDEYVNGTDPATRDTDGDGMTDGWEVRHGLNPLENDAAKDLDGDGYSNYQEYLAGSDPDNPQSKPNSAARIDFNTNSISDYAIWRPSSGRWYAKDSLNALTLDTSWGLFGDIPFAGDFDGDGKTDLGVWRPSSGTWYILLSSYSYSSADALQIRWGCQGDIPLAADYNGDGITDLGIWRPTNGYWYIKDVSGYEIARMKWGNKGDVPVPADYNGDGITDLGIWRPTNGYWYLKDVAGSEITRLQWGNNGDIPLAGDLDNDGTADLIVWRPASGYWYGLDVTGTEIVRTRYGNNGDIPVLGDYDGDGRLNLAVWRPTTGQWWVLPSGSSVSKSEPTGLGSSTDLPVSLNTSSLLSYMNKTSYYKN